MKFMFLLGFDSYVGETVRTSRELGLVEMKYRFCSSGHGTYFRKSFHPRMFRCIKRVNRVQFRKLQKATLHPSFDVQKRDEHMVRNFNIFMLLPNEQASFLLTKTMYN
jgi:hypothetical protein